MQRSYPFLLCIILIIALLSGCLQQSQPPSSADRQPLDQEPPLAQENEETPVPEEDQDLPEPPPEPEFREAKLIAVGDIMMHLPQTRSGYDPDTDTYAFDSFFTEVRQRLSTGDWVIGNLETPLVDGDKRGYTGYPEFNAPPELADALVNAGFNVVTTANNHALDRRENGVLRTLENVRSRGLYAVGTAASAEEAETILLIEQQDITMAILSYTYGTNGIPIPEGKSYLVNLIDEERMLADIVRAKELQADIVTVALHFGNEYQSRPTEEQKKLVRTLFEGGADIILGSHPHVLQPYEWLERQTQDGTTKQGIVIYSMGNFISNQDRTRNNNHPTEVGVIFEVGLRKQWPDGEITFTRVEAIPTYVHKRTENNRTKYRVLTMESLLTLREDEFLTDKDYDRIQTYYEEALASLHLYDPSQAAAAP